MKCLRCDETKFIEKEMEFSPEIKGEPLKVMAPCMVCKNCQMQLMTTEQMGLLRRRSTDKYREQNTK
jgi:hypothetical protein